MSRKRDPHGFPSDLIPADRSRTNNHRKNNFRISVEKNKTVIYLNLSYNIIKERRKADG